MKVKDKTVMEEKGKRGSLISIYDRIGKEGFAEIAEWLLRLLCVTPLITGIINYIMLLDIPSYDPYLYNYRCIIVSSIGFILMTVFAVFFVIGKIVQEHLGIKGILGKIKCREPWLLWWIALLVWGIITVVASAYPKSALFGGTILYSGYITHIYMICVMICAYLLNEDGRRRVINTYVVVSDILAIIMISFNYDLPFFNSFSGYAGVATFTNSNHYGYYLAIAIPCLAGLFLQKYDEADQGKEKSNTSCIVFLVSYIIHMQAMVINDCMGAFLGVFFSLVFLSVFWIIRRRKLKLVYFIPMIMLVVMVYLSYVGVITSVLGRTTGTSLRVLFYDIFRVAKKREGYEEAGTNRIYLWKETIAAIKRNPVFGYGPDIMLDKNGNMCVSITPHNEFLECALYMGIPGAIMYLGGLITLFINRLKNLKKLPDYMIIAACAVIGYQISAFFGVRKFHIVPYMFMFLGMIIMKERKGNGYEKTERV